MPPKRFTLYSIHKVFVVVLVFYHANGMRGVGNPGPTYPPTSGEIWPAPQFQEKYSDYFLFEPEKFKIKDTTGITESDQCKDYIDTLKYGMELVLEMYSIAKRQKNPLRFEDNVTRNVTFISELKIFLAESIPREEFCPIVVPEDMKEAYMLNIIEGNAELMVYTVWGVMRGLTTFTQLFYIAHNEPEVRVNATVIKDFPKFAYRGIMLDTSRHFISVGKIKEIITAMKLNKLNVLHWHIVDDPSCPYQSAAYPTLSELGAFNYEAIYSRHDILSIIVYAKTAGVRVIPELNLPGHVQSWGVALPDLLTRCSDYSLGPIHFLRNGTFEFLKEYFDELNLNFDDNYIHIGGGDVDLNCWLDDEDFKNYMNILELKTGQDLLEVFINKLLADVIPKKRKAIVWQEVVSAGLELPVDTIVQVWQDENASTQLLRGYKVLFSTCFKFDSAQRETSLFEEFYNCNPEADIEDSNLRKNLVGGEALFWSDRLDDTNINSKMWPRGAAMAERLWSSSNDTLNTSLPYERLNEQICRMKRLQISVNPVSAGYCTVKKINIT